MISITAFRSGDTWRRPCHGGCRNWDMGPERCRTSHHGRCSRIDRSPDAGSFGSTTALPAADLPCRPAQNRLADASQAHLFSENAGPCKSSPRRSGCRYSAPQKSPFHAKSPLSLRTEGVKTRYHLWFALSSRKRPQAVPTHGGAITGAPDTALLGVSPVQAAAPGCISQPVPSPSHQTGGSLGGTGVGTPPCHRSVILMWIIGYLLGFVK